MRHPLAIDLFSGCGGLTLGLKNAGFKVVGAVELDRKARSTYHLNHPEVKFLGGDIRSVDGSAILEELKLQSGQVDLVAGCPPCQGFSRIRHKNSSRPADDERNALIKDVLRLVDSISPKMVMIENVPGLILYNGYDFFKKTLRSKGYFLTESVLNVAHYGVAQHRKRLILLGSRSRKPSLAVPLTHTNTVRSAISHLPPPGCSGDSLHDLPQRRTPRIMSLIQAIPKDGGSRKSLPTSDQLPCHQRTNGFSDVYGRMRWDMPSPTITGGCYNPSKGRFLHPTEDRAITLREAALLQGFPEDYCFDIAHGREAISLMIGNALPPPFIKAHAQMLIGSR